MSSSIDLVFYTIIFSPIDIQIQIIQNIPFQEDFVSPKDEKLSNI